MGSLKRSISRREEVLASSILKTSAMLRTPSMTWMGDVCPTRMRGLSSRRQVLEERDLEEAGAEADLEVREVTCAIIATKMATLRETALIHQ
jgi:hypothetical protein